MLPFDAAGGAVVDETVADAMQLFPFVPVIAEIPEPLDGEAPSPAQPFDRSAVERACARAARKSERVEASVMSDDGVVEHVCDVSPWLLAATCRELDALMRAGWTGDDAEEVAAALADDDPEVADVLRHVRRTDAGLVVEIDGDAALAWLARHRPSVAAALADEGDDDRDDEPDEG